MSLRRWGQPLLRKVPNWLRRIANVLANHRAGGSWTSVPLALSSALFEIVKVRLDRAPRAGRYDDVGDDFVACLSPGPACRKVRLPRSSPRRTTLSGALAGPYL